MSSMPPRFVRPPKQPKSPETPPRSPLSKNASSPRPTNSSSKRSKSPKIPQRTKYIFEETKSPRDHLRTTPLKSTRPKTPQQRKTSFEGTNSPRDHFRTAPLKYKKTKPQKTKSTTERSSRDHLRTTPLRYKNTKPVQRKTSFEGTKSSRDHLRTTPLKYKKTKPQETKSTAERTSRDHLRTTPLKYTKKSPTSTSSLKRSKSPKAYTSQSRSRSTSRPSHSRNNSTSRTPTKYDIFESPDRRRLKKGEERRRERKGRIVTPDSSYSDDTKGSRPYTEYTIETKDGEKEPITRGEETQATITQSLLKSALIILFFVLLCVCGILIYLYIRLSVENKDLEDDIDSMKDKLKDITSRYEIKDSELKPLNLQYKVDLKEIMEKYQETEVELIIIKDKHSNALAAKEVVKYLYSQTEQTILFLYEKYLNLLDIGKNTPSKKAYTQTLFKAQEGCYRQYFDRDRTELRGFYIVTRTLGIGHWNLFNHNYEHNQLPDGDLVYMNSEYNFTGRGGINSGTQYVIPNKDKNAVKYQISIFNMTSIRQFAPEDYLEDLDLMFTECFFKLGLYSVCCSSNGYIYIHTPSEESPGEWYVVPDYTYMNPPVKSCMMLNDGYVIVAGNKYFEVLNSTFNRKQTQATYGDILQLAEIKPRLVVSVESTKAYIYSILSFSTPVAMTFNYSAHKISSVISLNDELFAIGMNEIGFGGRVDIYNLQNDVATIQKFKRELENVDCTITNLKEVRLGTIIIAGDIACEKICMWNYLYNLSVDEEVFCWQHSINDDIIDIIPQPVQFDRQLPHY